MRNEPAVSVIMIFLNAGRYIAESIETVLSQTYENFELILVDDGSSDGSTRIARACESDHADKVRYLEHPGHQNLGMSASRNAGISHARGRFIAFLDADDKWLPRKLETQVAVLEGRPDVALVYDASMVWYPPQNDPPREERLGPPRRLGVEPNTLIEPPRLIPLFLRGVALTPGTCSVLVRREAVRHVGGFMADFRGLYEDQVFFYKLCLEHPVFLCDGSTALYRQHADSSCYQAEAAGLYHSDNRPSSTGRRFLEWLNRYLRERGIEDSAVHAALEEATWPYRHPVLYAARRVLARHARSWAMTAARRSLPPALRKGIRRLLEA